MKEIPGRSSSWSAKTRRKQSLKILHMGLETKGMTVSPDTLAYARISLMAYQERKSSAPLKRGKSESRVPTYDSLGEDAKSHLMFLSIVGVCLGVIKGTKRGCRRSLVMDTEPGIGERVFPGMRVVRNFCYHVRLSFAVI